MVETSHWKLYRLAENQSQEGIDWFCANTYRFWWLLFTMEGSRGTQNVQTKIKPTIHEEFTISLQIP